MPMLFEIMTASSSFDYPYLRQADVCLRLYSSKAATSAVPCDNKVSFAIVEKPDLFLLTFAGAADCQE